MIIQNRVRPIPDQSGHQRRTQIFRRLLPIFFILFCACSANASSFTINNIGVFSVNLSSPGFSLSASGRTAVTGVPALGFSGSGGSILNLSGSPFLIPPDFNTGGSVFVNGTTYPIFGDYFPPQGYVGVYVDLEISAGSVTIPLGDDPTVLLTAPMTLRAGSRGITGTFFPVFSASFYGSGGATVTLQRLSSGDYYAQSVSYSFNLVNAPEPTTLILFGSGILGIIGAKCHKRRNG